MSKEITEESIIGVWADAGPFVSFEFLSDGAFKHINRTQRIEVNGTWELYGKNLDLRNPNGSMQAKVKIVGNTLYLDFGRAEYQLTKA